MESALAMLLVESCQDKKPRRTDDFVLDAAEEYDKILTKIRFDFDTKLAEYHVFYEPVNPMICKKLENEPKLEKIRLKKPNDIKILCEIEAYQRSSGKTCLLATTDRTDFLNNRPIIESLIGVRCIDPIYLPNELET